MAIKNKINALQTVFDFIDKFQDVFKIVEAALKGVNVFFDELKKDNQNEVK